ncbi:hypothetical protein [Jiulongibacter sediminis]|jgi:hypothetical protein|uniref:hypothetical protein n=1 Tax=Jiulongibacter sediminis TaxID=1605367 RepID=UPI0026E929E4|nr:hypothetical protein [Jiulongibacter sediminis]
MKKYWTLFFGLLLTQIVYAQQIDIQYQPPIGQSELTSEISIPAAPSGYSVWMPEGKPKGAVVFFHAEADSNSVFSMVPKANARELAVIFVSTANPFEFLFEAAAMQELEAYIEDACQKHEVPTENLLFGGMSLEGTRALKMAVFSQSGDCRICIQPKAVMTCDSPLDMVRFWKEADKAWRLNITEIGANEGKWVSQYLSKKLGGKPEDVMHDYVNYSPYCYVAEHGGNARFFKDIAVRAYTEPDVHWWIENRGKDYYGMNAIDAAALINQLKIDGNRNAELVLTEDKGYRPDNSRHPHSWSIVDEEELLDWFLSLE